MHFSGWQAMNPNSGLPLEQQDEASVQDIEIRKRWQELTLIDEKLITGIDQLLQDNIDDLIEKMYSHFLSFPQTKKLFPDEATLKRAQAAQARYFLRLTKGNYDKQYIEERLHVGRTHYRIGLDPHWYLGAYRLVLSWFREKLVENFGDDPERVYATVNALAKITFFDMSLAIDAYTSAKEEAIRKHRDSIAELESDRRATRNILENAPIGIVRLNPNFNCVEFNKEFMELVEDQSNETLSGRNLFEICPYLPQEEFKQILETGQPYRKTAVPVNLSNVSDLTDSYWDWSIWPIKNESGEITGIVAEFVDVTNRILLQRQREDFVATLTHDLKTPILAANRAVKLLIEGDFGPISKDQTEILETIHSSPCKTGGN